MLGRLFSRLRRGRRNLVVAGSLVVISGVITGVVGLAGGWGAAMYVIPLLVGLLALVNLYARRFESAVAERDRLETASHRERERLKRALKRLRTPLYAGGDRTILGVHESVRGEVPYIKRAADRLALDQVRRHGMLLVRGDQHTGKSRLALETAQEAFPQHKLVSMKNAVWATESINFNAIHEPCTGVGALVIVLPENHAQIEQRDLLRLQELVRTLEPEPILLATVRTSPAEVAPGNATMAVEEFIPHHVVLSATWQSNELEAVRSFLSRQDMRIAERDGLPALLTGEPGAVEQLRELQRVDPLGIAACRLVHAWSEVTNGHAMPEGAATGLLALTSGTTLAEATNTFDAVVGADEVASGLMKKVSIERIRLFANSQRGYQMSAHGHRAFRDLVRPPNPARLVWASAVQVYSSDGNVLLTIGENALRSGYSELAEVALVRSVRSNGSAEGLLLLADALAARGREGAAGRLRTAAHLHGATSTYGFPPIRGETKDLFTDDPWRLAHDPDFLYDRLRNAQDERSLTAILMLESFYAGRNEQERAATMRTRAEEILNVRRAAVRPHMAFEGIVDQHGLEWFLEGVLGIEPDE